MSRTEDLTAKFRTLSYDHERMLSMHRTANEKASNAERETSLHKSRLTYVKYALLKKSSLLVFGRQGSAEKSSSIGKCT